MGALSGGSSKITPHTTFTSTATTSKHSIRLSWIATEGKCLIDKHVPFFSSLCGGEPEMESQGGYQHQPTALPGNVGHLCFLKAASTAQYRVTCIFERYTSVGELSIHLLLYYITGAKGLLKLDRTGLSKFGGPVTLSQHWTKSLMCRMGFVLKRELKTQHRYIIGILLYVST